MYVHRSQCYNHGFYPSAWTCFNYTHVCSSTKRADLNHRTLLSLNCSVPGTADPLYSMQSCTYQTLKLFPLEYLEIILFTTAHIHASEVPSFQLYTVVHSRLSRYTNISGSAVLHWSSFDPFEAEFKFKGGSDTLFHSSIQSLCTHDTYTKHTGLRCGPISYSICSANSRKFGPSRWRCRGRSGFCPGRFGLARLIDIGVFRSRLGRQPVSSRAVLFATRSPQPAHKFDSAARLIKRSL